MAQTHNIEITAMAFPDETPVAKGDTVVWTNRMSMQHTVTADDGSFDSGLIDPNRSYERVFDRPGDYAYHCTPHPFMTGHVIVEP